MMRVVGNLLIACGLMAGAGCSGSGGGGSSQPPQESTLHEVADLIRAATGPTGKGPTKPSDFDRLASVYARAHAAVKSGDVVVLYGAGVQGEGDMAKGGGDVIAYEKDTPNNGGYVLLTSGEVKKMTAAEFGSAPKAGKK